MQRVCVLVGPTASGKTSAALAVAQRLGAEIVSADSMQVYRGMDIGTAKATAKERSLVAHHLLDVADPREKYTAARYQQQARAAVADIHARGKLPLVVGGTGLYVSALIDGLNFADVEGGGELREKWSRFLEENGPDRLHAELAERDAEAANRLHPNDTRRVVRALEVFEATGVPLSMRAQRQPSPYQVCIAGLNVPRAVLNNRIDERVHEMVAQGLMKEAKALFGLNASTAAQALGYKELFAFFKGECKMDDAIERIQRETRRYAKRQMTWFRRDGRIRWFDALKSDLIQDLTAYYDIS